MNGKLDVKVEYMFDEEKQETEVSFDSIPAVSPTPVGSFPSFTKNDLSPTLKTIYPLKKIIRKIFLHWVRNFKIRWNPLRKTSHNCCHQLAEYGKAARYRFHQLFG